MEVKTTDATDQITADRCNRQLSCANIGKGRMWKDRYGCVVDMDKRTHDLVGPTCGAVDATRLATCLHDIRDQTCEASGEYPASCQGVRLCR